MENKLKIMDVTLRDGSYAINFQFSEYDTESICSQLDESGIRYIEIGHGMGIGANTLENGKALCTDNEYLSSAKKGINTSKYGMFCIPEEATFNDLLLLKDKGASFVRIGSNVSEVKKTEKYIKKAKELELEVMANYMKSYVATPKEFSENVKMSEAYGADVVYVVDSAGSMNGDDIENYFDAIRAVSDIKIGFHGHNNLGLAISNSLYAAKLGYDFVDTSLLGIGRSAGNAATEIFIANLLKQGKADEYNLKRILNCAEKHIRPLMKHNPNQLDLYCGIAEFHTSYIKYIHKYASKYRVNPLDLILEYSKYEKVDMNEKVLEDVAKSLEVDRDCILSDYGFNEYIGEEQKANNIANQIKTQ